MTNTVEKIDTTSFDDAIRKIWDARDAFYEIKRDFDEIGKNVMANWDGEARNEFKKSYNCMARKIKDEEDNLTSFGQELEAIRDMYKKADEEIRKQLAQ